MHKSFTIITSDGNYTAESIATDGKEVILKNASPTQGFHIEPVKSLNMKEIVEIFID